MEITIDTDISSTIGVDATILLFFLRIKFAHKRKIGFLRTDNSFQLSSQEMYECGLKAHEISKSIPILSRAGIIEYSYEKGDRMFRFKEEAKAIVEAIKASKQNGRFRLGDEEVVVFEVKDDNIVTRIREWAVERNPNYYWDAKSAGQAKRLGEMVGDFLRRKYGACDTEDIIKVLDMMVDHSDFPHWMKDKWDIPMLVSQYNQITLALSAGKKKKPSGDGSYATT